MSDAQRTHGEEGNTPLDEDEMEGLIPSHISTRAELNAWEAENIRLAIEWTSSHAMDILDAEVLIALHRRMFDQTWRWAGKYRTSEKSTSPRAGPDRKHPGAATAHELSTRDAR
jgi:fido (protein-threonine AMPylation protein)